MLVRPPTRNPIKEHVYSTKQQNPIADGDVGKSKCDVREKIGSPPSKEPTNWPIRILERWLHSINLITSRIATEYTS